MRAKDVSFKCDGKRIRVGVRHEAAAGDATGGQAAAGVAGALSLFYRAERGEFVVLEGELCKGVVAESAHWEFQVERTAFLRQRTSVLLFFKSFL